MLAIVACGKLEKFIEILCNELNQEIIVARCPEGFHVAVDYPSSYTGQEGRILTKRFQDAFNKARAATL